MLSMEPAVDTAPFISSEQLFSEVGRNTGNLAFVHAINRHLNGPKRRFRRSADPELIKKHCDVLVMPCANQVNPHFDLRGVADLVSSAAVPFVAVGLGAQAELGATDVSIPEGSLRWLRAVAEHAPRKGRPNISLRGEFSFRVMERIGLADNCRVLGCPSLFISGERSLGQVIASRWGPRPSRIAVAGGHHKWPHLMAIERSLTRLVSERSGSYICQGPLASIQVARGEYRNVSVPDRESMRSYLCPNLTEPEFESWSSKYFICFSSPTAWMDYLKRFDFVIGTRIHGVALALQVGIPALCIVHDSRTKELCEVMRIPYVLSEQVPAGVTVDDLERLFQFDPEEFDRNRIRLARNYVEFLEANGLPVTPYLVRLASGGAAKKPASGEFNKTDQSAAMAE